MQVILKKDVPKLGSRGDVKNVSDGHALNFLIPRGLVERATPERIAQLEKEQGKRAEQQEADTTALSESLKALDGTRITIGVPANEKGHLYEKIDVQKLAAFAPELSGNCIVLDEPLKETGEHTLTLTAAGEKAIVTLIILPTEK